MIHAVIFASVAGASTGYTQPFEVRKTAPIVRRTPINGALLETSVPNTARLYAVHGFIGALPIGYKFPLLLRTGRIVQVDGSYAILKGLAGPMYRGRSMTVNGYFDLHSVLHAVNIESNEDDPRYWPADGPLSDPSSRTKADVKASPRPF